MMTAMLAAAMLLAHSDPSHAADTATLRRFDQALLDAQGTGSRVVWMRYMSPDSVYVDENGIIMSRDAFLKQLAPLPRNVSGSIRMTSYHVSYHGTAALVIHTDDERELYHGQRFRTEYITTETWYAEGGAWKLALTHVYVVDKTPAAIGLPTARLEEYAGCYRAASDLHYRIGMTDGRLTGGVTGRKAHPLLAELADVFFVAGQPRVRMIFQRDRAGRISGYLSRREGDDIVWRREANDACPP
jgi:hypothetical protein